MPIISEAPIRQMLWEKMYGPATIDPSAAANGQKRVTNYQTAKTIEAENYAQQLRPTPVKPVKEAGESDIDFDIRNTKYSADLTKWQSEKDQHAAAWDDNTDGTYDDLVREGGLNKATFSNQLARSERRAGSPLKNLSRDAVQSGNSTVDPTVQAAFEKLLKLITGP